MKKSLQNKFQNHLHDTFGTGLNMKKILQYFWRIKDVNNGPSTISRTWQVEENPVAIITETDGRTDSKT